MRRAVDQAIEVIRRRVDALGTTEPSIQRQGADRILVQVPGLQDPQRLKDDSRRTAKLEFRLLAQQGATDVDMLPMRGCGRPARSRRAPRSSSRAAISIDAQPAFDSRTNEPIVNFRFNIRGAQRFGQATTENVGRPLAIVLDNEVISAPTIQSPITGGSGQISGRFTVAAGRTTSRCCCAPARCRPSSPSSRSAPSVRASGAIPSRPARWPPTWPASS